MRKRTLLAGVLLVVALPAGAGDKLAMQVSPAFAYAPASMIIRLAIEPDPENRAVLVVADSEEFYRSSQVELDGDRAPRTSVFRYRSLPAGDYQVRSVLIGARGEARAMVTHVVTILRGGGR